MGKTKKQASPDKRKRDDSDKEEDKKTRKRFTTKYRDLLKEFMEQHPSKTTTEKIKGFGKEHGFTFSQVKHNWYDVVQPILKEEQKKLNKQKVDDLSEKFSKEINEDDIVESEEEQPVFNIPIKISKVAQQTEVSFLKPFRFETKKHRFFVFRYPSEHLNFVFKGVSCIERTFEIDVNIRGLFSNESLIHCFSTHYDLDGLKENSKSNFETFTLTELLPKDIDLKSVQYGENYEPTFGPIFVVTFDKKVSTFVPVKQASWSLSLPPSKQAMFSHPPQESTPKRTEDATRYVTE